jgi:hypothetical protein
MNVTAVKEFTHAGRTVEFRSRHDFVSLAGPGTIGAELGTGATTFCIPILQRDEIDFLYTIDEYNDRSSAFTHAVNTISTFDSKVKLIRETFEIAAQQFDDKFFDWIYVDGFAHDGQNDGKTFTQWWPKLKPGGVFGGNGYDMLHWPLLIRKLHSFALAVGRDIYVIDCEPDDPQWGASPSWFMIK